MAVLDAYDEIITMLGSQYAEINGCDFYQYIFPDNEESGKMYMDFSHPNAVYLYQVGGCGDGSCLRILGKTIIWSMWRGIP